MKKLIIFDLDGVLVDTKKIHFNALNTSLKKINQKFVISYEEHLRLYDALSTSQKLKLLTKYKNLPKKYWKIVYDEKQQQTFKLLKKSVKDDHQLINFFQKLKKINTILL